jgi:hypothetical protein
MFSCTTAQHIYCTNCTVCNWTVLTVITQKLLLHVQLYVQQHSTFTVQNCTVCNWTVLTVITQKLCYMFSCTYNSTAHLLYKLYSLQLNCTYSNYTEAAATCSAAQQHSIFTVQILYRLYSLQMNCTYSNYTETAATCSVAQQERNCPGDVFWSRVLPVAW